MKPCLWCPFVLLLTFAVLPRACRAETLFTVMDLGTLGGHYSSPQGINNYGQVVGYSETSRDPDKAVVHAFRTAPNRPINPATDDLGTLGGAHSYATGVNSVGSVVGYSDTLDHWRAFRTRSNAPINRATDDLGIDFSRAYAVNDAGQSVGYYASPTYGAYRAFRAPPDSPINPETDDLGTLGGRTVTAYGINSAGQVIGSSSTSVPSVGHAFRTAPNSPINPGTDDLGTLGGTNSRAVGINAAGQVAGYADLPDGTHHAFRTAPNSAINPLTDDLGTLGGLNSEATAINSGGWVVGKADRADKTVGAFLFDGVRMRDLQELVPLDFAWHLAVATGINDSAQIIAEGYRDWSNDSRAFLLTPIPEPGTLALLASAGLAIGLLAWARRRRR